ncbi:MAG: threonine ammonia-lyase [Deltaproteobacteria bacterium]|nr:threonine ammonia-lyase [Deltaproteobacteria bacterium]
MVTLEEIQKAAGVLEGKILPTPLIFSPRFSREIGGEVYLKLENLQKTGSFKVRGALYKIFNHRQEFGPRGVVAVSAGNHAQGVALAARQAGIPATLIMPEKSSLAKQEATRGYGGEVVLRGKELGEALQGVEKMVADGYTFIHPFDDPEIMAGQGTIGLEILQELPHPDLILVPVGGGGLIGGLATAVKALSPETLIFGVQSAACPSAQQSRLAGKPVTVEPGRTIADGIAVPQPGRLTFSLLQTLVDEILLADEEEIAEAILTLLEHKRILAEGAGATPVAALRQAAACLGPRKKVVLVISGGNIDLPWLDRVLRRGLMRQGRVIRLAVTLEDTPGTLAELLAHVARLRANILHLHHLRSERITPVLQTRVELELETRGWDHAEEIKRALEQAGYTAGML